LITTFTTQGEKKQLQATFFKLCYSTVTRGAQLFLLLHFHVSTVHVNNEEMEVQKKKEEENEGLRKTGKE
jgi:hypothetical protein